MKLDIKSNLFMNFRCLDDFVVFFTNAAAYYHDLETAFSAVDLFLKTWESDFGGSYFDMTLNLDFVKKFIF